MRMNDAPAVGSVPVDLGCIPAHLVAAAARDKAVSQDRDLSLHLYLGIDDLITINEDLSAQLRVVLPQSAQAVNPPWQKWIEVGNIRRGDFQKPVRIAAAPTIERGSLHVYNLQREDRKSTALNSSHL